MKTSMTLTEMATEIDRQAKSKEDFIAPTNLMTMQTHRPNGHNVFDMELRDMGNFEVRDLSLIHI